MIRTFLFAAAVVAPSVASAATWTVCASACDFASVRAAHTDSRVVDLDTLSLSGTVTEATAVTITKDLTIVGAGSGSTALIATHSSAALYFDGATASLGGITVDPATNARAIHVQGGANVQIDDVRVTAHTGSSTGLGLYVDASTASVSASTFDNIDSSANGGCLYAQGGAIVTLDEVSFSQCDGNQGGAIYVDASRLTVTGGSIASGWADTSGAGVYLKSALSGYVSFTGTTFDTNASNGNGGAVYTESSYATFTSCDFTNNDADVSGAGLYAASTSNVTIDDCAFSGNQGSIDGAVSNGAGADIRANASNVTIRNGSTFTGAINDLGASIYADSGNPVITIEDSTFTGGTAVSGGHIYLYGTGTSLIATDTVFSGGKATTGYGGSIYVYGDGDVSLTRATFTSNSAVEGGAISIIVGDLDVADSTFTSNTATDNGGALAYYSDHTLDVSNSTFSSNSAATYGGAIEAYSYSSVVGIRVDGSTFLANAASADGGAISVYDADTLEITDNAFEANTATDDGGALAVSTTSGVGGAIYRNDFCDNVAGDQGGGAWLYTLSSSFTHRLASNLFVENDATRGGGVYVSTSTTLDALNNTFVANQGDASNGGGAYTGTFDFKNNLVTQTVAGDGFYTVGTPVVTYNGWYTNTAANATGVTLDATNVTGSDPLLFDYTIGDGCNGDFRARYTGPMRDEGTGTSTAGDLDLTTADIGMYGGPYADPDAWVDADGDGYPWVYDCDETSAAISPGDAEICDGVDQDCDGVIDDGVSSTTWYLDADGDGYGTSATVASGCPAPSGYVAVAGDCDDTNAAVSPLGTETCNGADDDCDGTVDDGVKTTYYADTDADGYGDPATTSAACSAPSGYVSDATDCRPADASAYPGAAETCDGVDDDCDSTIDEGVKTTYYADGDSDGYGDLGSTAAACAAPSGYVSDATDCRDSDATAYPGAAESCDGVDDDCDGTIDEGVKTTYYADTDGDAYGDAASTTAACAAPSGYVSDATDCAPADASAYPGAPESCDGVDDDCDGAVDDSPFDPDTFYADTDGDGFGDAGSTTTGCTAPSGYVAASTDCDDDADTVYPGAPELCNTIDDDCDGAVDDDVLTYTFYADVDGDGFGDDSDTLVDCVTPAGYVAAGGDCDDSTGAVSPDATEVCNGIDDDCNGDTDGSDAADATAYYDDLDEDGFGDAATLTMACAPPSGAVTDAADCDDADATIGSGDAYSADVDLDGLGDPADTVIACAAPDGYVANAEDCDDDDPSVLGGAAWHADADNDGYGDAAEETIACDAPTGTVADDTDCDDTDTNVSPGAPEQCDNGIDDDCDGDIDIDAVYSDWYPDADGDGYGVMGESPISDCAAPSGYVSRSGDCDDAAAGVNPSEAEVCNGVDDDCDGEVDVGAEDATVWYADADGDGVGDDAILSVACDAPVDHVAVGGDCDDADDTAYPGARELCDDGVDNDCDGEIDTDAAEYSWYPDADGDGYGDDAGVFTDCGMPEGALEVGGDCDDAAADVNPSATEVPGDGIDQDCDGEDGVGTGTSTREWAPDEGEIPEVGKGCGCAASPNPGLGWAVPLLGLLLARRRGR